MKKQLAQTSHKHDQKMYRPKFSSKNEYGELHVTFSNVKAFQNTPNVGTSSDLNCIFLVSPSSATLKHILKVGLYKAKYQTEPKFILELFRCISDFLKYIRTTLD